MTAVPSQLPFDGPPTHENTMTPAFSARYPCVVFDLDGTLLDTREVMVGQINLLLAELGRCSIGVEQIQRATHQGLPAMLVAAIEHTGPMPTLTVVRKLQASLRERYLQVAAGEVRCFPGGIALLEALRARDAWLAICSNQDEAIVRKLLDGFDLRGFFREIVGGDTLPRRKPDPYPLRWLIEAAGVRPAECVMVGDSEVDARCAARCGAAAVIMGHGYAGGRIASPHVAVADFGSLKQLLAS